MSDNFEKAMLLIDKATDKYFRSGFESMTDIEKALFCVWTLESEVNNGGFNQYYWNSAGDFSKETVCFLEDVGASETASILKAANENFGNEGPPKDRTERQQRLEELERFGALKLDSLDQEFYEYPDDLTELLYQFALVNGVA